METVGIITDPLFAGHSNGPDHPESPERFKAVESGIDTRRDTIPQISIEPRPATREELERVHTQSYVDRIGRTSGHDYTALDYETRTNRYSYDAARTAAGAVIEGIEALFDGKASSFFAAGRPPGHHAERARAMGFCIFNSIAVAAEHCLSNRNLERVLIVDWDVHHGNGTMHAFYNDPSVLYMSIHQFPHYPGTGRINDVGKREGEGFTVGVPLPPGCGDEDYAHVFDRIILPVAREYRPEIVLVSAGYDPDKRDPLAGMQLTPAMFAWMTVQLKTVAAETAGGRIGIVLEGGYNLQALEEGVAATVGALAGDADGGADYPPDFPNAEPTRQAAEITERCIEELSRYWGSL